MSENMFTDLVEQGLMEYDYEAEAKRQAFLNSREWKQSVSRLNGPKEPQALKARNVAFSLPTITTNFVELTPRDYKRVTQILQALLTDPTLSDVLNQRCGRSGLLKGRNQTYRSFFEGMLEKAGKVNPRTGRMGEDWSEKQLTTLNNLLGDNQCEDYMVWWWRNGVEVCKE
jgi:hypothetical protein